MKKYLKKLLFSRIYPLYLLRICCTLYAIINVEVRIWLEKIKTEHFLLRSGNIGFQTTERRIKQCQKKQQDG